MFADVLVILFHALLEKSRNSIPRHHNPTYGGISETLATPVWLKCLYLLLSHLALGILNVEYSAFIGTDSKPTIKGGSSIEVWEDTHRLQLHFSLSSSGNDNNPPLQMYRKNKEICLRKCAGTDLVLFLDVGPKILQRSEQWRNSITPTHSHQGKKKKIMK